MLSPFLSPETFYCIKDIQKNLLLGSGPWLLIYDLLELSAKLLLVDEWSGGCKEQAVKYIPKAL